MNKASYLLTEIANICKEKHYSIVTAESCTGGGLAYQIIKNPQSSSLLERGYVTYSITSKEDVLNVSNFKLQTFGAVSKQISMEMATRALKKSKAQVSISITGLDYDAIKEEGLSRPGIAWISCISIGKKPISKRFTIKAGRKAFCEQLILNALTMLRNYIK